MTKPQKLYFVIGVILILVLAIAVSVAPALGQCFHQCDVTTPEGHDGTNWCWAGAIVWCTKFFGICVIPDLVRQIHGYPNIVLRAS